MSPVAMVSPIILTLVITGVLGPYFPLYFGNITMYNYRGARPGSEGRHAAPDQACQ